MDIERPESDNKVVKEQVASTAMRQGGSDSSGRTICACKTSKIRLELCIDGRTAEKSRGDRDSPADKGGSSKEERKGRLLVLIAALLVLAGV